MFLFSFVERVNHLSSEGAPSDDKVDFVVGQFPDGDYDHLVMVSK